MQSCRVACLCRGPSQSVSPTRASSRQGQLMSSSAAKGKGTWSTLKVTHGSSNPQCSCSRRSSSRPASPARSAATDSTNRGRRFKTESFIVHGGACRIVLLENLLEVSPHEFGLNPLLLDAIEKLLLILSRAGFRPPKPFRLATLRRRPPTMLAPSTRLLRASPLQKALSTLKESIHEAIDSDLKQVHAVCRPSQQASACRLQTATTRPKAWRRRTRAHLSPSVLLRREGWPVVCFSLVPSNFLFLFFGSVVWYIGTSGLQRNSKLNYHK
jgi:hypothetical protein